MRLWLFLFGWATMVVAGATMVTIGVPAHRYSLICLGQTSVFAGLCGCASITIIRAIQRFGRPADQAFSDGFDSGYEKCHRDMIRSQVVRHLRSINGDKT